MPGDREAVGRLLEEALSGQVRGTLQVDFQLAQPPGESPVWIHSEGRVLFEPDGEVIGLIGTLVDVSEHTMRLAAEQHAHRQTEQARARLDELLRQAPLAVCILRGREMRFDLANDAYQRLVGRTDLVGRTVAEALPEVMTQGYPELLERVFTTGERVVSNEARLDLDRHHTGELETCFLTSTHEPFRDERREVAGILVTAIDVTELVRARRVAEEASVARGP